jgi:preprotein translocase subunit SecY
MSKKIKLILISVLVVFVILIIIGIFGANSDRIQGYFENRRAQVTYDQMIAEKNALEEKKKNDFAEEWSFFLN